MLLSVQHLCRLQKKRTIPMTRAEQRKASVKEFSDSGLKMMAEAAKMALNKFEKLGQKDEQIAQIEIADFREWYDILAAEIELRSSN